MRIVRHSGLWKAVTPPTISPGGRILLTLKIRAPYLLWPLDFNRTVCYNGSLCILVPSHTFLRSYSSTYSSTGYMDLTSIHTVPRTPIAVTNTPVRPILTTVWNDVDPTPHGVATLSPTLYSIGLAIIGLLVVVGDQCWIVIPTRQV